MKNLKKIAAAIIAVILFTNTATAQIVSKEPPLTVKYLGNQGGYLLFEVGINTGNDILPLLKINDKAEGELYSQNWKINAKSQIFKIEKMDFQELSFKLLSGKKVYSKNFSTNTSFVEKITVKENDVVVL